MLSKHQIDLPCPHCGHKTKQEIGRLERNPTITCTSCHKAFKVEGSQLRAATKKIDASIAELKRKFGQIGKR